MFLAWFTSWKLAKPIICIGNFRSRLLQIGSVHVHQPHNHHLSQAQQQSQQQPQQQPSPQQLSGGGDVAAASGGGRGSASGGVGVAARAGGMFCYHCPPGLPAPRLPPSLEYPFSPTHPCKCTFKMPLYFRILNLNFMSNELILLSFKSVIQNFLLNLIKVNWAIVLLRVINLIRKTFADKLWNDNNIKGY